MKLISLLIASVLAKQRETIIVEDDYDQYDNPLSREDSEYTVYDMGAPIGITGILNDEGGERGNKHKTCDGVSIPKIVCAGCLPGFPHFSRPCDEPEEGNNKKFKCRALCGRGFKPTITRMKCVGGKWKKLPANGKIRCQRIKKKHQQKNEKSVEEIPI